MLTRRNFLKTSTLVAATGALSLQATPVLASTENTMSVKEAIFTRRSVRSYTEEAVSQEHIDMLIKAAMQAPSAGNNQPWEFLVVTDKAKLEEITQVKKAVSMAKKAPLGILTCINRDYEKLKGFGVQSVCCATQNILLMAHSLGLGAVWTSVYPNEEFVAGYRKVFSLPENIIPVAFVVIGHPKKQPAARDYFKPERVHINTWK